MNCNYGISAIVIIDNHTFLVSACLFIIILLNCDLIIHIIKNTYLHTEYDDLGLDLKDLTINTRKHSHKR
jgi:hypothetical protein